MVAAQRGRGGAVARVVGGRVVAELVLGGYGAGHGALADAGHVGGEGVQGRALSGAGGARGQGARHVACCEGFHLRDSVCCGLQ